MIKGASFSTSTQSVALTGIETRLMDAQCSILAKGAGHSGQEAGGSVGLNNTGGRHRGCRLLGC